ncbi:hypothetical protein LB507_006886 [Fusarium sp. FIESC RH6]|nr:hypothetical protein LB507_006886 [Fusarium sp. FIESC RH6]
MGGKAFSRLDPPLETPRMPKETYLVIKNQLIRTLAPAFGWIDTPIEGPGKKDYGDIDLIVSGLIGSDMRKESILNLVYQLLGAQAQITEPGSAVAAHFAIPWPEELPCPEDYGALPTHDSHELNQSTTTLGAISPDYNSSSDVSRPQSDAHGTPDSNAEPLTLQELRDKGKMIFPLAAARQTALVLALNEENSGEGQSSQANFSPGPDPGTFPSTPTSSSKKKSTWFSKSKPKTRLPRSPSFSSLSHLISKIGHPGRNAADGTGDESKTEKTRSAFPDSISGPPSGPCIQVDVHFCFDVKEAKYLRFHQAHGDMWQLLGSIIKPFGLTVDNKGLWIRIPEVEKVDRKRAKILLTSVPNQILDFIGVPVPEYWRPFADVESMFQYVAKCNMFWVDPDYAIEQDLAAAKSNDRQRISHRPVYRQWITEFKPRCREQGLYSKVPTTREEVRDKAFETFKIETDYHERLREFIFETQKNEIVKDIKAIFPAVAQPTNQKAIQMRSLHIKAMREIIIEQVDEERYNIVAPAGLRQPNGLFNMDRVRSYARSIADEVAAAVAARSGPSVRVPSSPRARRRSFGGPASHSRSASG